MKYLGYIANDLFDMYHLLPNSVNTKCVNTKCHPSKLIFFPQDHNRFTRVRCSLVCKFSPLSKLRKLFSSEFMTGNSLMKISLTKITANFKRLSQNCVLPSRLSEMYFGNSFKVVCVSYLLSDFPKT